MPNFESSSFNKSIPNPTKPIREFSAIGDPDEMEQPHSNSRLSDPFDLSSEDLEEIKRMRQTKLNPAISHSSKKRIEYLADLGKTTKDVKLGGEVFTLRTLKAKELREASLAMEKAETRVESVFAFRKYCLAFSLMEIDHKDLEILLDIKDLPGRLKLIDDMEENIVIQLFSAYNDLKNEADTKYALKTDNDVKEVAEDLKK